MSVVLKRRRSFVSANSLQHKFKITMICECCWQVLTSVRVITTVTRMLRARIFARDTCVDAKMASLATAVNAQVGGSTVLLREFSLVTLAHSLVS